MGHSGAAAEDSLSRKRKTDALIFFTHHAIQEARLLQRLRVKSKLLQLLSRIYPGLDAVSTIIFKNILRRSEPKKDWYPERGDRFRRIGRCARSQCDLLRAERYWIFRSSCLGVLLTATAYVPIRHSNIPTDGAVLCPIIVWFPAPQHCWK